MCSGDEPELDAPVHDAHLALRLDAPVAVPDHVLVEHAGELVDRDALEAALVEELLPGPVENPSAAALSGLHHFALIDLVNPWSTQMRIHSGHR